MNASVAFAEPALHWVRAKGAEACIEPAALAERVEALTGTSFVAPAGADISLEGLVEPAGKGYRVRLASSKRGEPRSAERVLTSSSRDCRRLDAAVAFVIALTLNPSRALEGVPADVLATFSQELPPEQSLLAELDAQPPVVPDAAPNAISQPAAPIPSPAPAPAPPPRRRYGLSLGAAASGGSAPHWLGGARASFAFAAVQALGLELSLGAFPNARREALGAGRAAVFQGYDATLSACPGLRRGRWHGQGCAGIVLSYLRAQGRGFERNRSAHIWDPLAAFGLGLSVELARGWGLYASATLRVRLRTMQFEFAAGNGQPSVAYRPSRVGGVLSLGPHYEF